MKTKDKEYHALRDLDTGKTVFEECTADDSREIRPMSDYHEGKPIPKDAKIVIPEESSPGHYRLKEVRIDQGPVKVTTNKYRDGWDRIFGGTGGMKN